MALKSLSTAELRRELERRERGAKQVAAKRDKLAKQLAQLDAELADLGAAAPARRGRPPGSRNKAGRGKSGRKPGRKAAGKRGTRKRASNPMSLSEAVAKSVRVGKTVSPAEVLVAVKKIYTSTSKNLGMMVANTLAKHPEFKKLGRGQYTRVGGKAAPAGKPTKKAGKRRKAGKRKQARKGKARKGAKGRSRSKAAAKSAAPAAGAA